MLRRSRTRLASLLRDLRGRKDLSKRYMARAMGVSQKTYRDWESGERSIQSEHLPMLALVLAVDIGLLTEALLDPALVRSRQGEMRAAA